MSTIDVIGAAGAAATIFSAVWLVPQMIEGRKTDRLVRAVYQDLPSDDPYAEYPLEAGEEKYAARAVKEGRLEWGVFGRAVRVPHSEL